MNTQDRPTGHTVHPAATPGIVILITTILISPLVSRPGAASSVELEGSTLAAPHVIDAASAPAGADASWWREVTRNLAAREYQAATVAAGFEAPNRAHNLRVRYRTGEVEIVPRKAAPERRWQWRWRTTAWGRLGTPRVAVQAVAPQADGARVEYRRDRLVEWYDNSPAGLEQGFVLDAPPCSGNGRLCVEGLINTSLHSHMNAEAQAVDFLDGNDMCVIRYDQLVVSDAAGRSLESELGLDGDTIRLLIDDREATYPILVDPILSSPSWVRTGAQSQEQVGYSVATAGDVDGDGLSDVIVGAPWYEHGTAGVGRVELYLGTPAGLPTDPDWTHGGSAENDHYGRSVGSAGDVNDDGYDDIVIGAEGHASDTGLVDVFHGSHAGPPHSPDWSRTGERPGDRFGWDVGTAGDTNGDGYDDVIIGAPGYSSDTGRGYVWLGSGNGLREVVTWNTIGDQAGAEFGTSVGTAGDTNGDGRSEIIVGAPHWADVDADEGAAFVYRGSETGPINIPFWTFSNYIASSGVGNAVATAGDLNGDGYCDIIIGADRYDTDDGAVYIAMGTETGPEWPPSVLIAPGRAGARFGCDVGPAGDVNGDGYSDVIIGAYRESGLILHEGRASVYLGSWSGVATTPYWTARGFEEDAMFGFSVATAGDVDGDGFSDVLVGAPGFGRGTQGQARQYAGGPDGLREMAGWVIDGSQERANFGYSVASAGDVNGDGFSDVLVGAPEYDVTEDEGLVALFLGSHHGLSVLPNWWATGDQFEDEWGSSVASAGDVNGDGYDDILIGSHNYTNTVNEEGGAFLWLGTPAGGPPGTPHNAHWSTFGGVANSSYGYSVASAGDVNGDGFADIIVGAPDYTDAQNWEGGAFVFFGSETGPSAHPNWFHFGDQAAAHYGVSVSSAGDFNGDGLSDVIVGADRYDHPTDDEGAAFLYLGSPDGPTTGAPDWHAEGDQADCRFGGDVASAGDVNGDSYSDVIIGARQYNAPAGQEGMAFVWYGAATPPPAGNPTNPDWSHAGNAVGDYFGHDVSSAGDVNGDGYSDIAVSESRAFTDSLRGVVHVWHGSPSGLVAGDPDWSQLGAQANGWFGWDVASAGDVNGDGFTDLIVGAIGQSYPEEDEGRAYVYYGNDSRGISRIPQQMRTDFSAPIGLLGESDAAQAFGLRARGRTPMGRGEVRLEWEVKPFGTPFDGTGLGYGTWTETGAPAGALGSYVVLTELATGLVPETTYHWRFRIATDSPFFPHSPWLTLPYNCATELDLRTGATTGLAGSVAPRNSRLHLGVHPNPVLARTTLTYRVPERAPVRLGIYDLEGRMLRMLVDATQDPGDYELEWNGLDDRGCDLAAGIYFVRLECDAAMLSQKMLLMP